MIIHGPFSIAIWMKLRVYYVVHQHQAPFRRVRRPNADFWEPRTCCGRELVYIGVSLNFHELKVMSPVGQRRLPNRFQLQFASLHGGQKNDHWWLGVWSVPTLRTPKRKWLVGWGNGSTWIKSGEHISGIRMARPAHAIISFDPSPSGATTALQILAQPHSSSNWRGVDL